MVNVTPINATFVNATGDDSDGLSFVPGVLATHCERVPDALLSDATYCGPISMLAFAVLAYAVYMVSPVVLEAIKIVKEIVVAKARRVLGLDEATPADEATGGPFASDSVMLIVCADGHGDVDAIVAKFRETREGDGVVEHMLHVRDLGDVPRGEIGVKRSGAVEHTADCFDVRDIPCGKICVEVRVSAKENSHVGNLRDVPFFYRWTPSLVQHDGIHGVETDKFDKILATVNGAIAQIVLPGGKIEGIVRGNPLIVNAQLFASAKVCTVEDSVENSHSFYIPIRDVTIKV